MHQIIFFFEGDIHEHVSKMNNALRLRPKLSTLGQILTVGEFFTWLGLFFAASTQREAGRVLFEPPNASRNPSHFSSSEGPRFDRFMTRHRWEDIKAVSLEAFSDASQSAIDPWCFIRPLITAFNENRKLSVVASEFVVVDESMSAFRARHSKTGNCECHPQGLPHLSFVERKPGIITRTNNNTYFTTHTNLCPIQSRLGQS